MRLHFTGFGPFAKVEANPSWDAAQAAAEAVDARAVLLPVDFEAARVEIPDGVDLVVHFGLGRRREDVCLERYAHNWWSTLEDEASMQRIDPTGAAALECALDLDGLARRLDETAGVRWRVSHDAGPYVCNATLYHSLARYGLDRAMFVHIPDVSAADARMIGATLALALRS